MKKYMHFLFCPAFLFEAGDCLNLCLSFLIQCINVHVYSLKQCLGLLKDNYHFMSFFFKNFGA